MNLFFDRGTIIFKDPKIDVKTLGLSEIRWDERIGAYRTPGCFYQRLVDELGKRNIPFVNNVYQEHELAGSWKEHELRPYQDAALHSWLLADCRGIVVLPTGAGKTRTAIAAIAKQNVPTLCLVPTRVLLEQWYQQLKERYSEEVGIFGDGTREFGLITVATYESAYRNIEKLGNKFQLLIIDEVHHFGSGLRSEILELSIAHMRLGLTATLPKDEGQIKNLERMVGPLLYELNINDLRGKYLANFDCYSLRLELTPDERKRYETEIAIYTNYHLKFKKACPEASFQDFFRMAIRTVEGRKAMSALRQARKILSFTKAKSIALSSILQRHKSSRVLIFTADTETAYTISKQHFIMPLTSHIGRKEREQMLTRFRTGEIKSLVSCRVLNEGLDAPEAEIGIILGGALGEREHIQRVGRLLRVANGKRAIIYELICARTLEVRQWKKRNESFDYQNAA